MTTTAKNNWSDTGTFEIFEVMNTYALLRAGGKPTAEESMKNYDGNICRCTGYRNLVQAWVKVSGMEESG